MTILQIAIRPIALLAMLQSRIPAMQLPVQQDKSSDISNVI